MSPVEVNRSRVLAFRRRAGLLDERRPFGPDALRRAAWAGLQDSMPRAALLSLHARVEGVPAMVLADDALVQVWGPRHQVYVVARRDLAVFTLGRLPTGSKARARAEDLAARLADLLGADVEMPYGDVGRALDVHPNALRYAAPMGTVLLRWDGARQPTIRWVAPPEVDPADARRELARRHLRVAGPSTPDVFARWAGVSKRQARTTFAELAVELVPVRTAIGDGWVLGVDQADLLAGADNPAAVRLLPSGDAYWLLHDEARRLLVEDSELRDRLWTPRVWPGALLVAGEIVGTWRRAAERLTVEPWRRLTRLERAAVEAAAATLPLPGVEEPVDVAWVHELGAGANPQRT